MGWVGPTHRSAGGGFDRGANRAVGLGAYRAGWCGAGPPLRETTLASGCLERRNATCLCRRAARRPDHPWGCLACSRHSAVYALAATASEAARLGPTALAQMAAHRVAHGSSLTSIRGLYVRSTAFVVLWDSHGGRRLPPHPPCLWSRLLRGSAAPRDHDRWRGRLRLRHRQHGSAGRWDGGGDQLPPPPWRAWCVSRSTGWAARSLGRSVAPSQVHSCTWLWE